MAKHARSHLGEVRGAAVDRADDADLIVEADLDACLLDQLGSGLVDHLQVGDIEALRKRLDRPVGDPCWLGSCRSSAANCSTIWL